MEALKDTPTVLMFHAETLPPISKSVSDSVLHGGTPAAPTGPHQKYQTFLDSRPVDFETYAIEKILAQAHIAPDLRLHIVHLSAADGIPLVKSAKERGIKITAETCFHYLTLASEDIQDGDTRYKCCPPIREASNRDHLWDALKDGVIETVVSDHSPCTPDLKMLVSNGGDGDFFHAWGGVSTVGLGLSVLWTEGKKRGIDIPTMAEWTSYKTAEQVGLLGQKGALEAGWDADICIFDPEATFKVCNFLKSIRIWSNSANGIIGHQQRNPLPQQGHTLRGQGAVRACSRDVAARP
jgi:allantoinase